MALAASLTVGGCSGRDSSAGSDRTTAAQSPATLHVMAAASLRSVFTEIGKAFEAGHPGTNVEFTFEGSSTLVSQLEQGAEADVLATADTATMDKAWKARNVINPIEFAANRLVIVVAPGNPKHVESFKDLSRSGLDVVICAVQLPCGAATATASKDAEVQLNPVSEENSVTDVLNKVTTQQADAGVVYVTDAKLAGDKVTPVAFPEARGIVNTYPIAVTANSHDPERAHQFIDTVTAETGHKILAAAGFSAP